MGVRAIASILAALVLAGCASISTTELSQNTVQIKANTAPACGAEGAAKVADKEAAAETIRRGYDRFLIVQDEAEAKTFSTPMVIATGGGGMMFMPGVPMTAHSRELTVRMFRANEAGAAKARSARETLGPEWKEIAAKSSRMTCLD